MDRAAELDLALDVDHLAAPRPGLAGDAGRTTEPETADLDHAEAVHLSDARAVGIDERDPLENGFLRPVADARSAPDPCLKRALDVGAGDCVPPASPAQKSASISASRKSFTRSDSLPE